MGWTVHDVKQSSVWEFFSAWQGFLDANTPKQNGKLSEDQKDQIWSRMQELEVPAGRVLTTQTYSLDRRARLVPAGAVTFEVS